MVIDKIGNINNITETKKNKAVAAKKEAGKNDTIQISNEGKQAAEVAKTMQLVKETPDMRVERVKEIKERIQNGTYDFDNNQMLDKVAEKIADFLLK